MMSDRLVQRVTRLDIEEQDNGPAIPREIRSLLEIFLRFTHRYWFHDVSDHVQTRDVFHVDRRSTSAPSGYTPRSARS